MSATNILKDYFRGLTECVDYADVLIFKVSTLAGSTVV